MAIFNADRLKQYQADRYNVLFRGKHGIGKTAIIKKLFDEKYGPDGWLYFSAPTLDPWVDFVGVPKVVDLPSGEQVLRLIRPEVFEQREIRALFFDEFNRAADKVVNAVMELIQFKSINGHKHEKLEVVWAAVNPMDDEDTYNVNYLDPAQMDRFQVHLDLPFKVDDKYFIAKYPKFGQIFIDWWKAIPKDLRELVSPRRLDYAADAYERHHPLEDFLDPRTNVKALRDMLLEAPFMEQVSKVTTGDAAVAFLSDPNHLTRMLDLLKQDNSTAVMFFKKFTPALPQELLEPFVTYLQAKKKRMTDVKSIEELVAQLPARGDAAMAEMVNMVKMDRIAINQDGLNNAMRALHNSARNKVVKLANALKDVVLSNVRAATLERVMWNALGRAGGLPSNCQMLLIAIGACGNVYSATEKKQINMKLVSNDIVDAELLP